MCEEFSKQDKKDSCAHDDQLQFKVEINISTGVLERVLSVVPSEPIVEEKANQNPTHNVVLINVIPLPALGMCVYLFIIFKYSRTWGGVGVGVVC